MRISSLLQIAACCLLVTVYFLEPKIAAPGQSRPYLEWSPTYWFLGLFQQLAGSPALANLAQRAWIGLAIALTTTAAAYILSYLRTMRKIVEEPDITPATALRNWIPPFGNPLATAIGQFSIRTLLRSRQHRLMFAFYLGVGFAATIFFVKTPSVEELPGAIGTALLGSSILVLGLCIVGTRVAFSLPLDLRANWIFRIMPIQPGPNCLVARRRALYAIGVIPAWTGSAALFFSIWPPRVATQHLAILALVGAVLAELCLRGTQKIPFTCSYLPGKSNFNITFLLSVSLVFTLLIEAARFEREAFDRPAVYGTTVAALAALAVGLRLTSSDDELQFEEPGDPALFALDLHRDGITPLPSD